MKAFNVSTLATLALCFRLDVGLAGDATSFVPSNPPEMKPLTNRHSPAHQAARRFRHGINLGNCLEVPPGRDWNVTVSAGEFALMRAEGFDHVRVPVGWHHYAGPAPDFTLSPEIFARVDFVVTNALAQKLAVIINLHHFNEFTNGPAGPMDKFLAIWRQIAAHYVKFPQSLAFELLNEPHDAAKTEMMNPVYARAITEIRRTNPRRTIFVEPGNWADVDELKNLVLPANDNNLIVSVHCYEPYFFTHQGAPWGGLNVKVTGIQYPGPPAQPLVPDPSLKLKPGVADRIRRYNTMPADRNPCGPSAFTDRLKLARAWSDYYGRPVHVGEFGCYTSVDPQSRARFLAAFRQALDGQKLGWAMWDWSASFCYWDKTNNRPMPGLHEALFGNPTR